MKALAIAIVLAMSSPGVASAAGWFLVLSGNFEDGIVIVPEKYPTRTACNAAGRSWEAADDDYEYRCVPAP